MGAAITTTMKLVELGVNAAQLRMSLARDRDLGPLAWMMGAWRTPW